MIPFPTGQYSIIYADPPWQYRDKALAGLRGAECKYTVMTLDDIKALPIASIAAKDCWLFMWVTDPFHEAGYEVIRSWGFTPSSGGFTWIKTTKNGKLFWGMGAAGSRSNPEFLLMSKRGKPKRISAAVHSVIMSQIEGHSKKPGEARERIVKLCGDLPRIELFARQKVDGWDGWGNEYGKYEV